VLDDGEPAAGAVLPSELAESAGGGAGWQRAGAGILFPTGDADSLADALQVVLGDPLLRRQLAEAGSQLVRPYDWSVVASQVLRVYEIAAAAAVPG
jgi:glycosyltransferase involved in cell wall biosynthesis